MSIKAFISGVAKLVGTSNVFKVFVGGVWKDVAVVRTYSTHGEPPTVGWREAWVRAAVTPTPPPPPDPVPPPPPPVTLTVNVVPTEIYGSRTGAGVVVTQNSAVAQASGGTPPYVYQWVLMGWSNPYHTPVITTPQAAQTTLSNQLTQDEEYQNAQIKCIVTDSLGNTGQGTGIASFYSAAQGGGGGGWGPWDGWSPEP